MARTYEVNHPLSGHLFTFSAKADAEKYVKDVFAATGYAIQAVERGTDPEPVVTITDPVTDNENAPKGVTAPVEGTGQNV